MLSNPYKKYKTTQPQASQAYATQNIDGLSQPIPQTLQASQHIKISIRLKRGIVTSLTLKKSIIAIWLLYTADTDILPILQLDELATIAGTGENSLYTLEEQIEAQKELDIFRNKFKEIANNLINNFVYKCLNDWDKDTGKGLSEFVTEIMIKDFLDDYELYELVLSLIKE